MGVAEVISCEEVRARKPWDSLRQQLHERFAQWRDILEPQWHEPPSTFTEVTTTVWDLRQQLTGGITETVVAQVHRGENTRPPVPCPQCDGVLRARARVCRPVETMVGPVQLERPYVYGRSCRWGCYPSDEALGVVAGGKQLDRQKAAAQLVTDGPDDTAQSLFGDLTGVSFGSARMHTVTNQVAEGLTVLDVAPAREEITRRVAAVVAGRGRRPVVVLGIDGAYGPTRPERARESQEGPGRKRAKRARWRGQGRDAKGFRLSLIDGDRIVPLLSWHQGHNEEQLGEALQQSKDAGLIPEDHVRLCGVADGASWIWQHVKALFPGARQVLASDHCVEYLHGVAKAHYGASVRA